MILQGRNFDLSHLCFLYRISEGTIKYNKHMDKLHVFTFNQFVFGQVERKSHKKLTSLMKEKIPKCTIHG